MLPDLEQAGNFPVSVHVKWGRGMIFVQISSTGGSGVSWMFAAWATVDLMPCLFLCKCLKMLGIYNGKYFETNSFVKPGNVAKLLLSIALSHVLLIG